MKLARTEVSRRHTFPPYHSRRVFDACQNNGRITYHPGSARPKQKPTGRAAI